MNAVKEQKKSRIEDIVAAVKSLLTKEENEALYVGRSNTFIATFVSLNGFVQYVESTPAVLEWNDDMILDRAKLVVRRLRAGKRHGGLDAEYNWLEVLANTHYFLESVLEARRPGMTQIIEDDLKSEEPGVEKDRGRFHSVMVNRISEFLKEMS